MLTVALLALGVLVISIVLADRLAQHGRGLLGVILGLLPMAIMEAVFHGSLYASVQRCLDSACASAGLPPGCTIAEFGCTEWSGLSVFLFWAVGFADLVLYMVALLVIFVIRRRRETAKWNREGTAGAGPASR
ncbi:MAG: hypothetical protein A2Y93_17230 [Chloroflexi bacterium RBG_13_68_17]|nr:MAG: hypothetical protein A2Y93_17230 [Chloroflexi bacterium RBG_13_68_17]